MECAPHELVQPLHTGVNEESEQTMKSTLRSLPHQYKLKRYLIRRYQPSRFSRLQPSRGGMPARRQGRGLSTRWGLPQGACRGRGPSWQALRSCLSAACAPLLQACHPCLHRPQQEMRRIDMPCASKLAVQHIDKQGIFISAGMPYRGCDACIIAYTDLPLQTWQPLHPASWPCLMTL